MTIGNISKEICHKPSSRTYVLLGYLPTTWLETVNNQAKKWRLLSNIYHACMTRITEPLKSAGEGSVNMSTATGHVHRNHPIFGGFISDYPEQVLNTCTLTGDCPNCGCTHQFLGDFNPDGPRSLHNLDAVLTAIDSFEDDPTNFLQNCSWCLKVRLQSRSRTKLKPEITDRN